MNCTIQFNAFIGGSIGATLYDYFRNHPLNNPNAMKNYRAFNTALRRISGKWFPESGYGAISNKFARTDDRTFGEKGTSRLYTRASIDLATIGNMRYYPFNEPTCDDSHRRSVYIYQLNSAQVYLPDMPAIGVVKPTDIPLEGDAALSARSGVKNTIVSTHFTRPGTPRSALYDATVIKVGASAGYPYMEPISPNIDFDLTFTCSHYYIGSP